MKHLLASVLCLLITPLPASAEEVAKEYNAETMLKFCTEDFPGEDPEMQSIMCTFRLQGVVLTMVENCLSHEQGYTPNSVLSVRLPPSTGAARQAFVNYMTENRAAWGTSWHHAVYFALSEEFPCEADG